MKLPLKNVQNNRIFRFISNKYIFVLLIFLVWMLFLDNYSFLEHNVLNNEIEELENNKEYYQNEIKNDLKNINHLKSKNHVEKYAREKYYMKKDSEDIYIIEFEGDKENEIINK